MVLKLKINVYTWSLGMSRKVSALLCNQNNQVFYVAILTKEILENSCFVLSREEDAKSGFQRNLNKSRAKDIAHYIDVKNGVIPSAIILSAQKSSKFKYIKETGEISFSEVTDAFMVLDGQHRLYGLQMSQSNHEIPVVIFNDLERQEEVNLFIDINTTQKGVPTALLLDIKNLSGQETTKEEKQRKLFDLLNENSVMAGEFSPSKSRAGKITRVVFNAATNDIFDGGFFKDKSIDIIYQGVKNYLEAIEVNLIRSKSTKAKLTNANIFKAVFAVFYHIIDITLNNFGNLKVESLEESLEPISRINYDNHTGSNNAALTKLITEIKDELHKESNDRYSELNNVDLF